MNIDPNLIAAAVDGWKVAAAGLAIAIASGFLGHKLGRRPNAERERMLRRERDLAAEERDANAKLASEYHAEWVKTLRLWNDAMGKAFDEAIAANKLRGELEDARDQIRLLEADLIAYEAKRARHNEQRKALHRLHKDRERAGVPATTDALRATTDAEIAVIKATHDAERCNGVSGGAA